MYVSDVMVSKVGGMATTESLISCLPIIAISPIPGQEMRNAKFLTNNGVGFRIKKAKESADIISWMLSDKKRFDDIKSKIHNLAKPNAVADISKLALENQ